MEQQIYNVHMMVQDTDFNHNSYEKKLHVLNEARHNQLWSEILTMNMLTDLQGDIRKIEDLLRPWVK